MANKTPLYDEHIISDAKMVDFHGWDLPIHYGSQLDEHHQVRQDAGMFDVSHMHIVEVEGAEAENFLRYLLANDVAKLKSVGKALYTPMLNEKGGIIDDLIVYRLNANAFRLVLNGATREKDIAWLKKQIKTFDAVIQERSDLVIIAVQGPHARQKAASVLPEGLARHVLALMPFNYAADNDYFVARTGYTGEDGFEIIINEAKASKFWRALKDSGIKPCGLGARDTLRLEAGLNLYGADMDESVTPLEANIAWTVAFKPEDRDFIGRAALEKQKEAGQHKKQVGLLLLERGVLRSGQKVFQAGNEVGVIVSGTFSPTLSHGVAFARVDGGVKTSCQVEVRGKLLEARVVKLPFVRLGKAVFEASPNISYNRHNKD